MTLRISAVPVAPLLLLWLGMPGATPATGQQSPDPAGDGTVAGAQQNNEAAADPANVQIALTRVVELEDEMRKHGDPVLGAYGLARMAAMVCEVDPIQAMGLFREAVQRSRAVSGDVFLTETKPLLAVASFTGLWNPMLAAMEDCQAGLSDELVTKTVRDGAQQRILVERTQANQWIAQARRFIKLQRRNYPPGAVQDRPVRAGQLLEGVLTAANLQTLDFFQLGLAMSELRERAPPLVDNLFYLALARIAGAEQPSTAALLELGKFLFVASLNMHRNPDELYQSAQNGSIPVLAYIRRSAYPHHVEAYIDAVLKVAASRQSQYWQQGQALSLLRQMQPIAYQMDLDVVQDLQKLIIELGAQPSPNPDPGLLSSDLQRARKVNQVLAAIRGNQTDKAASLIPSVGDTEVQTQLTTLNEFKQGGSASLQGDPQRALMIANGLPQGLKRTVAYASVMHAAGEDFGLAGNALSLGIDGIGPLPAEFQAVGQAALAQALLSTDQNRALTLVGDLVATINDARRNPQRARLENDDQRGASRNFEGRGTDAPEILLSPSGPKELIWSGLVQHEFNLAEPGVDAFSLPGLMRTAVRELPNLTQLAQLDAILADLDLDTDLLEARLALLDALFH